VIDTEDDLIKRLNKKDSSALRYLFDMHYLKLCNYAYTFLKDMSEAEDVVQNLFVEIWERKGKLEIRQSLQQYLFRAVYYKCLNALEYKQVRRNHSSKGLQPGQLGDSFEDNVEERRMAIQSALEKLPEKCKQVFVLSRFEELKYAEIADKLGISINTVENHMGKALKLLRAELKHLI
jgi:RNA polymerase sigma-70 factor (ECF subfamily)